MKKAALAIFTVCLIGVVTRLIIVSNERETAGPSASQSATHGSPPVDSSSSDPGGPTKESWTYNQSTDEMTGKVTKWACIRSENQLHFDFPYAGGSTGFICLRKGRDLDAYFKIDKGQTVCGIEGCQVSLKVDGGPTFALSGSESGDGDPKFIFFNSYARILAVAKKAQEIKLETTFYQEGRQVLTFEPAEPLDPKW